MEIVIFELCLLMFFHTLNAKADKWISGLLMVNYKRNGLVR
jgi:hypothetical protein